MLQKRGMMIESAARRSGFDQTNYQPVVAYPQSPRKTVPSEIARPPYAETGRVPFSRYPDQILLHDEASIAKMRRAARLARRSLDFACQLAVPGTTTDTIDVAVHNALIAESAYPSPLNYAGFPKSLCSSVNEVICHGIPDTRPLQSGDLVSFDVSCYIDGVHGDNCASVIVGDNVSSLENNNNNNNNADEMDNCIERDWRGVPVKVDFKSKEEESHYVSCRRLVKATRESLYAAIEACGPGACLTSVGTAICDVADHYEYNSVEKYRGHGIGQEFHCPPYVKHYRNDDKLELLPGMIFTIEPMLTIGSPECFEWDDQWTVSTVDGGWAAQFEHTVLITEEGVEILTLP